ncbi:hypothetical protein [Commensalibacter communis]|uniref:hypothetical protein n=1 Tax=Commensalibacter communis TaxID=2972786 RepID=UPI0022FF6ADA|nr:hypothetical protein [Commensalibacter communis]CAI3922782.1 unnamed protein product [Commensalibacter communis]CAI3931938.1 unnamed protein product [Commensalibacter communis]
MDNFVGVLILPFIMLALSIFLIVRSFLPPSQKTAKCDQCGSSNVDCIHREEIERFLERSTKQFQPNQITTVKISKTYICTACHNEFKIVDYYQLTRRVLDQFDLEDQAIQMNRQKYNLLSE